MRKALVINSAKGGVGKTTVATGIARQLVDNGEKVSIIDLDVTTPNIGTVGDIPIYTSSTGAEMTKAQIKKFLKSSINKEDGWIIIDTPPTISSTYSAITEVINNVKFLFVTTPSQNAILDTGVGIKYFASRGVVPTGVVQNMVGDVFGDEFDSLSMMGVKTLGIIPLEEDIGEYFKDIVLRLMDIDFEEASTVEDKMIVMSTLTLAEVRKDKSLPLKFYNLETWDVIREKILAAEDLNVIYNGVSGFKSHYDISTEKLKDIIDCGETAIIMMNHSISAKGAPLPYEIREAKITYTNKVSKGLPMFILDNGLCVWHHECSIAGNKLIKDILDDGGIQVSADRIIQSLGNQLYLNRAFTGDSLDQEFLLIQKHIEVSGLTPNKKEMIYLQYVLETNNNDYSDFKYDEYIEVQKDDYPDFYNHLIKLIAIST